MPLKLRKSKQIRKDDYKKIPISNHHAPPKALTFVWFIDAENNVVFLIKTFLLPHCLIIALYCRKTLKKPSLGWVKGLSIYELIMYNPENLWSYLDQNMHSDLCSYFAPAYESRCQVKFSFTKCLMLMVCAKTNSSKNVKNFQIETLSFVFQGNLITYVQPGLVIVSTIMSLGSTFWCLQ